jgi:hypothetical protein
VTSNQYIFSREGGAPVYLVLEVENAKSVIPSKPESIEVKAEPDAATSERGALQVTLITGADVFALHLKIDGVPVERWQIPLPPEGGGKMSFILRDLPPEKEVKVEIASAGKEGPVSEYISVKAKTSSALKVPALPESPAFSKGGEPKTLGEALVWAVPEITKLSPVTGGVLLEKVPSDFRKKNAVWDGFDGSIRIAAARAEIFSFQLVFEGKVKDCRINVSSLIGSENSVISEKNVKLWLNWYVEGQAEYAIPLKGSFDCPSRDNAVEGQKLQAITVDCHIPKETKPGEYFGKVTVVAGGKSIILPLKIKVYDVVIPDDLNFNPELNAYNSVSKDFHKLAHYNRCTLNSLPYGQDGSVQSFIPKTKTGGHISDWSLYDETVGGVLDGSLFLDNPRSGVPAATFYLPFFEGWPLDYRKYFETAVEFANLKDSKSRLTFNLKAKPIKEAISTEYKESFKNCVREFYSHAKEKKWTRTIFQFYLNNKPSYNFSAWTLDEPKQYLDWAAINFWAELYKSAINDPEVYESKWQKDLFVNGMKAVQRERPVFLFRGDISRPQWQGELSDGLMNIMYANNVQFAFPRLMQVHKKRMPVILHTYGECNAVNRSNWESAAWCLQAYVNGCDGVLPWQSIGKQDALTKADNTGLLLFSKVHNASVASLRVHALRRGAQDVELLRLLQLKKGWNREQIAMLVGQKIKLRSDFKQLREDDATAAVFNELSGASFLELKESVMRLLTE